MLGKSFEDILFIVILMHAFLNDLFESWFTEKICFNPEENVILSKQIH